MTKDFSDDEIEKLKEHLRKNEPSITNDKLQKELDKLISTGEARKILDNHQANDTLTVSDQLPEATPEDGNWKVKVRKAINEANNSLGYRFNEDSNDSEALTFKDQYNSNNTISFSSPNDAYVEGEQIAFDELVVAAKKMGKTSIKFGKFEKHPEYKAMLCLACLKHDMEMSNAPELSDLKDNPQAKEALRGIILLCSKEAEKELTEAKNAFYTAVTENPTQKENNELKEAFDKIKTEKSKDSPNREEIAKLEANIMKHPLGKALYKAINEKVKIMKKGLELGIISKEEVTKYSTPKSSSEKDGQNTFGNNLNI